MSRAPLVSVVMPFSDGRRLSLARSAVNHFIRNHYQPYQLIIVNATDCDVLTNSERSMLAFESVGSSVLEIRSQPALVSELRNQGVDAAKGEWVLDIDDDDWFHPSRLQFQMSRRAGRAPVLLRQQLRVDVSKAIEAQRELRQSTENTMPERIRPLMHMCESEWGIPCTMLRPRLRTDGTPFYYRAETQPGEHRELLSAVEVDCGGRRVVADNRHNVFVSGMQWPILSIAFYHGDNTLPYHDFFEGLPMPVDQDILPSQLNDSDVAQIRSVLSSYNFTMA